MISDLFAYPFLQRALLACVMVGVLCPFVGGFVVLRRMSFFSNAISHSAFAGIALGAVLGIDFSAASVSLALCIALVIAYLSERTTLSHDTVIGIAFSGVIAAGMLLLGMTRGYRAEVFAYIFGDIVSVTVSDLFMIGLVGAFSIGVMLLFLKPFLQVTFNREIAMVEGFNVRVFEYLLFLIIALVVTVSLKIVGIILVTSLLIIPAAAAKNVASSMRGLFGLSCLFGVLSGIAGLTGSVYLDTASGPTIVVVSIVIFFLTMVWSKKG